MHDRKAQVAIEGASLPASHCRGQVATEFLLYTSLFIFILIAAFVSIAFIQNSEIPARESVLIRETGGAFSSALSLAVRGGQGFDYRMTFPTTLFGRGYEVFFDTQSHRLAISMSMGQDDFTYLYPMPDYPYRFEGCLNRAQSMQKVVSTECRNSLSFHNDGDAVVITQEE